MRSRFPMWQPGSGRLLLHVILSLLLVVPWSGCATSPTGPRYLSEEVRTQLGTIGMVIPEYAPKQTVEKITVGGVAKGAVRGAGKGVRKGSWLGRTTLEAFFLEGLRFCGGNPLMGVFCSLFLLFGLVTLVVGTTMGAVMGGMHGAIQAGDDAVVGATDEGFVTLEQAQEGLETALGHLNMQESLRKYVLRAAREKTPYKFVVRDDDSPRTKTDSIDYSRLHSLGIETVMLIAIESIDLDGSWLANDPLLALNLTAHRQLVRTKDGLLLAEHSYSYVSNPMRFMQWAEFGGHRFRHGLEEGYRHLANQIVEETFLRVSQPGSSRPPKDSPQPNTHLDTW